MNRLLLDTHAIVWWDTGSRQLGEHAVDVIRNASYVCVSAASEWELTIKAGIGKVALRRSILDAVRDAGFDPLPVTFEHAQALRTLRPIHKDPFDRLLIATAIVEGLTLVFSDALLAQHSIPVLDARR